MPGIASVLNTAKEALLTHQSSISVAGHNIANVDTPGYTRQVLDLTTVVATPSGSGFFGNGVTSDSVTRQYDQFMVKRLTDQNSTINNLEAMQQSLRVVETIFNEAPGLAVNDLLSQFWESWQGLSNNPELSSSRQTVIQQAELLNTQFNIMASEIVNTKNDISVSLNSSIADLNSLTSELATLNGQITASETDKHQQNDLRDRRDTLLQELSGLVNINYFETSTGAYTIMLADGHTLVEQNEKWGVDWADNKMYWLSTNSDGITTRAELSKETSFGGSIGGLVEINNQLVEGDPNNYLGRLNSLANSIIREVNQQHSQGVGTIRFSDILTSAEAAEDAVLLHSTVDSKTATETIAAGTLIINDHAIGRIDGGMTSYGLAKAKSFNASQAINNAYAGVHARLTTQVAGDAVAGGVAGGLNGGESVNFSINGLSISYGPAAGNETALQTATNIVNTINGAITTYNAASGPENIPKITIRASVGNNLNGGATDSIVLQNTNLGDESHIIIAGVDSTDPAESKLGLTDGTYEADSNHNSGELSLFTNDSPIDIEGGSDDRFFSQLGWASAITYSERAVLPVGAAVSFVLNGRTITPASDSLTDILTAINNEANITGVNAIAGDGTNGGVTGAVVFTTNSADIIISGVDAAESAILGFTDFTKRSVAGADLISGDGRLAYEYSNNGVANSLMGLNYAEQLVTDGGSFDLWLYNSDGTPALPQAVNVSLERAYDLKDVANAINASIANAGATTGGNNWVEASVFNNKLILTPTSGHQFAFGSDSSNFLAAVGLNTFFTGNSADSIAINSVIANDMNYLAAGTINQFGEIFTGDNSNALEITNIQRKESVSFTGGTTDTLDGHYNSLVAEIGLKGRSVGTDLEFNSQVNDQLNQMRDATSGVSLDEEMANLIKFQHAYSAAAKLITASDEMLQTLLNSV